MDCTDGDLKLKSGGDGQHKYLQICHDRNWSYVCNGLFDHVVDKEVVLQQLNCSTGGIINFQTNSETTVYYSTYAVSTLLTSETGKKQRAGVGYLLCSDDYFPCFGVERRLIDCPCYQLIAAANRDCNIKITVDCNTNGCSSNKGILK